MTNEEAIKELQEDIELYIPLHGTINDVDRELPDGRLITALEMAIKALEQEPCKDAISRQSAIFLVDDLKEDLPDDEHIANMVLAHNEGILEYQTKLSLLPPVTPQPKTGHWSRKTKVDAYDIAGVKTWGIKCQCDKCDFTTIVVEDFGYYKYCPNCGARMAESEDKK